jgi:hypothetical protein
VNNSNVHVQNMYIHTKKEKKKKMKKESFMLTCDAEA